MAIPSPNSSYLSYSHSIPTFRLRFFPAVPIPTGSRNHRSRGFYVGKSSHSNPKILKSNRKSRFGQTLSPYDSDDEEADGDEAFDEDDDDDDDDWLSDDEYPELSLKSSDAANRTRGSNRRARRVINGNGALRSRNDNGFYQTKSKPDHKGPSVPKEDEKRSLRHGSLRRTDIGVWQRKLSWTRGGFPFLIT